MGLLKVYEFFSHMLMLRNSKGRLICNMYFAKKNVHDSYVFEALISWKVAQGKKVVISMNIIAMCSLNLALNYKMSLTLSGIPHLPQTNILVSFNQI